MAQHALVIGFHACKQPEGLNSLENRHAATVERAAAGAPSRSKQRSFKGKIDDLCDPQFPPKQSGRQR